MVSSRDMPDLWTASSQEKVVNILAIYIHRSLWLGFAVHDLMDGHWTRTYA